MIKESVKKMLCVLLAMVLILSACPLSIFAAENATTTAGVNLRSAPGTNSNVLGVVYEGSRIEVLDTSNSEWYKVKVNGKEGYITSEWIKLDEGVNVGSGSTNTAEQYKTTTDVNFRSGPSSYTTKIGTVKEGTIVTLIEKYNSDWYKIKTPEGTVGYLCTDYLVKYTGSSSSGSSSSGSGSGSSSGSTTVEKYVANTDVNFRSGPSSFTTKIGTVTEGTVVTLVEKYSSDWYKVKTPEGQVGYLFTEYLDPYTGSSSGSEGSSGSNSGSGSSSSGSSGENNTPSENAEQYKTTTDVNFRSGPSTSYSKIGKVPEGTIVTLIEKYNSTWYKIKTPEGTVGYLCTDYLVKYTGSSSSGSSSSGNGSGSSSGSTTSEKYVANTDVNFRSGPSSFTTKIGTVTEGTVVTLVEKYSSDWYKVKTPEGQVGYLFTEYLDPYTGSESNSGSSGSGNNSGSTTVSEKYKTTAGVYVRKGPGTNYDAISSAGEGTIVTVTDKSNGDWYKVTLSSGTEGYIKAEYLEKYDSSSSGSGNSSGSTETNKPETNAEQYKTTTDVNFRSGPSTSYTKIGTVAKGTVVTLIEKYNSTWYKIKTPDGTVGYLCTDYLIKYTENSESGNNSGSSENTEKYVTNTDVNFRSGPSSFTTKIGTVTEGTVVTLVEKYSSDWYKVKTPEGTVGYLFTEYLDPYTGSSSGSEGSSGSNSGSGSENSGSESTEVKYMQTTASSGLKLRDKPNGNIITYLDYGTVVKVLDTSNEDWYKVETVDGSYTGYVSSDYLKNYTPSSVGSVSLSSTSATIPQYSTYYVTASSSSSSLVWTSSDTSVATVKGGFIYAAGKGSATIYLKDLAGNTKATFKLTVKDAEAARFAYAAPIEDAEDGTYQFVAITDSSKTEVKFITDTGNTFTTTNYTSETYGNNTVRIFKATGTLSQGSHTVKVYSDNSSGYKEFDILVSKSNDPFATTTEKRMASVKIVEAIATFEGYVPSVTPDKLAYNVPTLGYGYVVYKNTIFYNNLTKTEALAMLYQTINEGSFTSAINNLITKNSIAMNQNQFDALISFSYNVGTSWSSSSTVRTLLLNSADHSEIELPAKASVLFSTGIYSTYSGGSHVATLTAGTSVTITDKYVDSNKKLWYKVSDGTNEGWLRGGNVKLSGSFKIDLNYIDAQIFAYKLLEWHVAGGNCLPGLLYRRLAEAKIFLYGNYAESWYNSANYTKNTYNFQYPSCMSKYQ